MSKIFFGNDKRGVSPLIATVLLIAFAVALGAVVMNWGRGFVQQQTDQADKTASTKITCGLSVNMQISEIDDVPQLCYGGNAANGFIHMVLDNNDETNAIEGIAVSVTGNTGTYNNDTINLTVPVAGSQSFNLTYSYDAYGTIKRVRLVPKIMVRGQLTPCSGSPLDKSASELRNCSS